MESPGSMADRLLRAVWPRQLAGHVSRFERLTVVLAGLVGAGILGFLALADAVADGAARRFDEWLLLALRSASDLSDPIGPKWFEEMMRDITALGGTAVLTLGVLAVTGFLALTRKTHAAVTVLVAVVSGMVLSQAIKWAYARPRPELVPHGMETYSASFPSGHSMMAAVAYLTLGALLARHQAQPRMKVYVLVVAGLLTVLVGLSRIYLGVHWPTDVLAGWCLGAAWAILCWFAMLWLQRRGNVEQPSDGSAG
jgi:undecaprenyl-diphosphatase